MNYWKEIQKKVKVLADGIPGPKTAKAIGDYWGIAGDWKEIQSHVKVQEDGIPGQQTAEGIASLMNLSMPPQWPAQSEIRNNKSPFGKNGTGLVTISVPYPLRLAWDTKQTVTRITCHALVSEALQRIFQKTLAHYGLGKIKELGLDLYGGCYNDRPIAGGKSKSMHAWGIAVDFDPDHNGMNTHAPHARFSGREYEPFWDIVEGEGAVSLGRKKDYDWMHFQFAEL